MQQIDYRLCLAPMMGVTHRYFRTFVRLLCPSAHLYSEMVTTGALLHAQADVRDKLLRRSSVEGGVALQLGGADISDLARCAAIAQEAGFCEVNLNVGCPSSRVQSGEFGACLMRRPEHVASAVAAMQSACDIPVTVKTRIGVDDMDTYEQLKYFVACLDDVNCKVVAIHARKAWLKGLNPKQNRCVPPLRYEVVEQIKRDFPQLTVILNGGIRCAETAMQQYTSVDGLMLGRVTYEQPLQMYLLSCYLDGETFCLQSMINRLRSYVEYLAEEAMSQPYRWSLLIAGLLGLTKGGHGAKEMRRQLCEAGSLSSSDALMVANAAVDWLANAEHWPQ